MGPRPDGRGRIYATGAYEVRIRRQWGRDRMAAEGVLTRTATTTWLSVNGAATGWPRKV